MSTNRGNSTTCEEERKNTYTWKVCKDERERKDSRNLKDGHSPLTEGKGRKEKEESHARARPRSTCLAHRLRTCVYMQTRRMGRRDDGPTEYTRQPRSKGRNKNKKKGKRARREGESGRVKADGRGGGEEEGVENTSDSNYLELRANDPPRSARGFLAARLRTP